MVDNKEVKLCVTVIEFDDFKFLFTFILVFSMKN